MKLREAEARSIREFVQFAAEAGYIKGDVLDFGCGKQPYRDVVESVPDTTYWPYDSISFPATVADRDYGLDEFLERDSWDTILCTQVVQYLPDPVYDFFQSFLMWLAPGGSLVMTYPTNWPEVEAEDLRRITRAGMEA